MTYTFAADTNDYDQDYEGPYQAITGILDITSYTASGEVLTATDFGLKTIKRVEMMDNLSDQTHLWRYDGKVRAYALAEGAPNTLTEASATDDAGAMRVKVVGL